MRLDFFDFFRYLLCTIATIYATVVTLQSLWGWYLTLAGTDKYIALIRRYVVVHGLRLRFKTFWGDVIICGLLCIVFLILWRAHSELYALDDALHHTIPAAHAVASRSPWAHNDGHTHDAPSGAMRGVNKQAGR
jgi:hypothetical protein